MVWRARKQSTPYETLEELSSLILLFLLSVVAILALVTTILLIRRGFRATSQPSTFEKVLARNVRNFSIPTHERNRKNPLVRGELEDRDGGSRTFCGHHPRMTEVQSSRGEPATWAKVKAQQKKAA
jgi:hypothetical protein